MLPDTLRDLLQLYARRGIADWGQAAPELRKRAGNCLGAGIAENETEANVTISTIYNEANASRLRFIPMPKRPKGGIERCFFLPVCEVKANGSLRITYELFLLVAQMNCLAFRFEPADPAPSVHDYGHIQMSRRLLRKTIAANTQSWMPDSYPAFPLFDSDPTRMFLSMATAVHGHSGGVTAVLQEIFQAASRAKDAHIHINELKKMLT